MQKIAIVTGGSKGIGLAIVEKLLSEKFRVITISRSVGELKRLKAQYGKNLEICQGDLSLRTDLDLFAGKIKEMTDRVDILVNNAGVFLPGQIQDEKEGSYELQMQLNITAPYHLTRALLPLMMPFGEGYIFNICSTASIVPYINGGSYCISKHALLGFSKVLRKELLPFNIGVSSIMPGATFTDSWAGTEHPESRFIKPETIAGALWYAWHNRKGMVMEEILLRPMQGDL